MILEPGWYLDGNGEPFKVWAGGGVSWYANEGDKGLPVSPSSMRMLALTVSDWELVRDALETVALDVVYSDGGSVPITNAQRDRLHALAGTMYSKAAR